MVPSRSPQAGLAAAVSLDPTRRAVENAAAMLDDARARCGPAPSPRPPATTPRAASAPGRRSGFVEEELVAWGEPRETLQRGARRGWREDAELITCLRGADAPLDDAAVHALVGDGVGARAVRRRAAELLVAAVG